MSLKATFFFLPVQDPVQGRTVHSSFTFLCLVLDLNSSSLFIFHAIDNLEEYTPSIL